MDETESTNGMVMGLTSQFERIVSIWDASSRGDLDSVRSLLECELALILMSVEMWTNLPVDSARKQMVAGFLEGLSTRLELHGNVIVEFQFGDDEGTRNCVEMCRKLLPHFGVPSNR